MCYPIILLEEVMKVSIVANTNGKGPNTCECRGVLIHALGFGYQSSDLYPELPYNGELRAFFEPSGYTPDSWSVDGFGLVCGDKLWIREFKQALRELGLSIKAVQNVKYSEISRQGENYVSLDIGQPFISSWNRLQKKQK